MNISKRIICLLLCLSFAVAALAFLPSCNGEKGDQTPDASESGSEATELVKEPNTVYTEDLPSYSLVIPKDVGAGLKTMAQELVETLNTAWGTSMTLASDVDCEESEYEILIGQTNRAETASFKAKLGEGQCGYGVEGRKIVILGSKDEYTERAITLFVSLLVLSTRNTRVKYMDEGDGNIADAEKMISVMSFNLKCGSSSVMQAASAKLVRSYMPDLLGVQEADDGWMVLLKGRLSKNGYAAVGLGRDKNNTGERSAIFYRTDKFELIEEKTMWLTDTPDEVSSVEGSKCNRIVTVVTLRRISDGKEFSYANTHLDHSTDEIRRTQFNYLHEYVTEFTDKPYVITGDFNFKRASMCYEMVTNELGYENCSISSPNARGRMVDTFVSGGTLDYCFRPKDSEFKPYLYAVCTERKNDKVLSDHYPIFFIFNLE